MFGSEHLNMNNLTTLFVYQWNNCQQFNIDMVLLLLVYWQKLIICGCRIYGNNYGCKVFSAGTFLSSFLHLKTNFFYEMGYAFQMELKCLLLEPEIWGGQLWKYEFWSDIWGIWSFCTQLFHTQVWVCSYPSCWLIHIFIQNTIRTIQ